MFHIPAHVTEELQRFRLTFFIQQILHIRRQAGDIAETKIIAVVLYELMGGRIVKVLGGRELGRVFAGEVHAVLFYELDKAVQLGGDQKCVDRVGEQKEIRRPQGILSLGEVFFQRVNPGSDVQVPEFNLFKMLLDEQDSLKRNAVFSGWGAIDDKYLHFNPPLASVNGLVAKYGSVNWVVMVIISLLDHKGHQD